MKISHYILDSEGNPQACDLMTWAKWFEEQLPGQRKIGDTTIGEAKVSTVFLGLDHSFGDGPPLLFETMMFGGKLSDEMDRYSTRAEALEGHEVMVRRVTFAERGN